MKKDAVILIPVYNPTIDLMEEFLSELTKEFSNLVFVDDGCDEYALDYLEKLKHDYPVIKHYKNLGKGRGIKNALNYILENYKDIKVIVTADCDNQHTTKDIKKCYEESLKHQDSLILGVREFDKKSVPFKSFYGNQITKNILYNFYGFKISDTQTGLRAMSKSVAIKLMDINGERYEYETNVLLSSKKLNIKIHEVLIETIYINDNKSSHFNPIKDSIKIYSLFKSCLILMTAIYVLENIVFASMFNIFDNQLGLVISLLTAKIITTCLYLVINKSINMLYLLTSILISLIILSLVGMHVLLIKIVLDIILLVVFSLRTNFKIKQN